jgi:squamous cell carcinoma antigen recognized by T-cells 3
VTLADSRVRARNQYVFQPYAHSRGGFIFFRNPKPESGLGPQAEAKSRSVRVRNLPKATQEGLLQQCLEKHAHVKRVEVFANLNEATVELESTAVSFRPS